MEQAIAKIGVREFRNNISKYLSAEMLAVTHHGRTVGYYIPVHHDPASEDFTALKQAAGKMSAMLAEHQVSEEDIVADFRRAREGKRDK